MKATSTVRSFVALYVLLTIATQSSFSVDKATLSDAGAYALQVRNVSGSVTSAVAVLTVDPGPAPANDAFSQRTLIMGVAGSVTASNRGSTKENGEMNHAGHSAGKSIWWTWTAPATGGVSIDTSGSSLDTVLAVYTGTSLSALVPMASDDDRGGNGASRVEISAKAGTVIQIAVDASDQTLGSRIGNIVVNIQPTTPFAPQIGLQPQSGGLAPASDHDELLGNRPNQREWRIRRQSDVLPGGHGTVIRVTPRS